MLIARDVITYSQDLFVHKLMIIYVTGGKIGKWEKSFLTTEILLKRTFRKSIYNQTEMICAVAKTKKSRVDSPGA